jgi:hypothetical protein
VFGVYSMNAGSSDGGGEGGAFNFGSEGGEVDVGDEAGEVDVGGETDVLVDRTFDEGEQVVYFLLEQLSWCLSGLKCCLFFFCFLYFLFCESE